jgi:hypothetical protein
MPNLQSFTGGNRGNEGGAMTEISVFFVTFCEKWIDGLAGPICEIRG